MNCFSPRVHILLLPCGSVFRTVYQQHTFLRLCFSIFPQKTVSSTKVLQDSRRRLLQPRSRPQGILPAAGTPPGASPASSSAEFQLIHPPYIQSSLSLISSSAPAICVYHRSRIRCGPAEVCSTSSSALFWYLFLENCFVLFLLFDFDGSTLCICIHAVQTLPLLSHRPERVQGSRSWLPASKLSPSFMPAAPAEDEGTSRTSLPSHVRLCFLVYPLKSWCFFIYQSDGWWKSCMSFGACPTTQTHCESETRTPTDKLQAAISALLAESDGRVLISFR